MDQGEEPEASVQRGLRIMASNRGVTYIDINLNTVEEYWDQLIVPSISKFQAEPSTAALFGAALNVWHLHDWVWHDQHPGENSRGVTFDSYRERLLQDCPELGWLRDIADASKHRGLGRLPEVKGAEPQLIGSLLPLGLPIGEQLVFFLVMNDGSKQPVDEVLRTAIEFWRKHLAKNLPSPYA
jgi:hypothetical protein